MEKYKKVLKRRITIIGIFVLLGAFFGVYNVFFAPEMENELLFGFQSGLAMGLTAVGAVYVIKLRGSMESEEKLKMRYNKENDERKKMILSKAGLPMVQILACTLIALGMLAGYFNTTVFFTLVGAALLELLVAGAVKVYYMVKL